MKKILLLAFAMVLLVFSGKSWGQTAFPTLGFDAGQVGDVYIVQPGDNLWDLEEFFQGNPQKWRRLLDLNPYLKKPGRVVNRNGKTIVIIKPDEELRGLQELGILPTRVPIQNLRLQRTASSDFWFWVAVALLVIAVLFALHLGFLRGRRRDPVTSGEPVVPGGILPGESERVRNHFDAIANRRFASSVPNTPRPVRIGPIESGFLSGNGVVRYRDGNEQHHQLNRQPAFRARFRLPNGAEETLFFLQGCANDVTFSETRYVGFVWETEEQIVPAPAPVPVQPERVVPLRAVIDSTVATKFTVDGIEIIAPAGTELRVSGANTSTSLIVPQGGGEVSIRKVQKTKKQAAPRRTEVAAS